MGKRLHRNFAIRGVTYGTAQEAAAAHGVSVGTIYKAIEKGTLDRVGLGQVGKEPMRIVIRGKVYKNAQAAARAFGVTPAAIFTALYRGRIDQVGVPRKHNHATSKPFTIAGVTFPSMRAASLALGFNPAYVHNVLESGSTARFERMQGAAMAYVAKRDGQSKKRWERAA